MPSLSAYLFLGLETSFRKYPSHISATQLFAMFLLKSQSDAAKEDKSLQLEMVKASAEKGHIPAQAVIERVYESYGIDFTGPSDYLVNGAATGSIYAMLELAARDVQSAEAARMRFLEDTGYNQFFSPLLRPSDASQTRYCIGFQPKGTAPNCKKCYVIMGRRRNSIHRIATVKRLCTKRVSPAAGRL